MVMANERTHGSIPQGFYTFYNKHSGRYLSFTERSLTLSRSPSTWAMTYSGKTDFYVNAKGTELLLDIDMPWRFEGELLADLKLAYVLERNHAAVALMEFPGAPYFYGSDIAKAYAARGKDFSVRYDIFGCAKRFLDIKEVIGWEPFFHTFRHLYEKRSRYAGISDQDKFSLFINTLSLFSGRSIKSFFSADEWLAILREIRRDP